MKRRSQAWRSVVVLVLLGGVWVTAALPAAAAVRFLDKSGETLAIDTFDLPPGQSVTIEFEVTIDDPPMNPPTATQVCNQGDVIGDNFSPVASDDPTTGAPGDPTCIPLLLQADLSVTKTDGVTSAVPGQQVVYTIVAANAGPSGAFDAIVADTFPASLSCSWTSVTAGGATGNTNSSGNLNDTLGLPVGASVTYTVTCDIDPGATGTLSNTVTISSAGTNDPVPGNNSATDSNTTLTPQADLAVTKTDGVTSAVPGQQLVYTVVATNNGPSNDPSVSLGDTFPASLTCSWTSVAAGGATGNTNSSGAALAETLNMPASSSVTYTVTCDIASSATGTLSNTATATASVTDPVPGNNSATDNNTTLTPQADISVTKTDGVTSAVPGQQLVYTIVASNGGPSDDPSVGVNDPFPASLTCSWTSVAAGGATGNTNSSGAALINTLSLPSGGSVTYTVTCDIASSATGTLSNTVTATASVTDPTPGNNSATDNDTALAPQADISVTKTDGVTSAVPGQQLVYTIVASNGGPSDDPSVGVNDPFPASLTCSWTSVAAGGATGNTNSSGAALVNTLSLPSGGSVTYTVTCDIASSATGTLSNTVTATASVTDPTPGNNSATDNDTALAPQADVSVSKDDGTTSAVPGGSTQYTIVAANAGPSDAPSVTVSDSFPATLTCSWTSVPAGGATGNTNSSGASLNDVLSLPSGGSVTYTVDCDIDPGATGTVSNTATVSSTVTDPVPGNNSATDVDTLLDLDFGDAPDQTVDPAFFYPTRLVDDGARHVVSGPLFLGAAIDNEVNGQPDATATGDDNNGTADEDGVTFDDDLVACETAGVTVTTTVAGGRLYGWIDWNADGDWGGANEQVFNGATPLVAGPNALSIDVPCDAVAGPSFARFRLTTEVGVAVTGLANDGEVEDYAVTVYGVDFGDAPDTSVNVNIHFPTRLVDNGARHVDRGGPYLGALLDVEADGQPNAAATGDDTTGTDDEDGVVFTSALVPGANASVDVTTTVPNTLLQGWIDWNADGDWQEANERIFTDEVLAAPGAHSLTFAVPPGIGAEVLTYARFRLTTNLPANLGLSFAGLADDGEVEDYRIQTAPVGDLSITKTDGSGTAVPGGVVVYTITAANAGPSTLTGATVSDTFAGILTCGWTSVAAGGATGNTSNPGPANLADVLTMPSGSEVTYTVTCDIDPGATGSLANTATITAPAGTLDPNLANNSATDTDTLTPRSDLSVTKDDGVSTAVPGQQVVYTIVAANAGPSHDPAASVSDTFPASLTCAWTSVAAGGASGNTDSSGASLGDTLNLPDGSSVTYIVTCDVDPGATGTLANTATVTSSVTDPTPGNNSATDSDTLTPEADLSITKDDGVTTAVPGQQLVYTIVAANAGPSDDPAAAVSDTFPASLTCAWTSVAAGGASGNTNGSGVTLANTLGLPAGSSVTYTVTCSIDPAATGTLSNTATVTASVTDPVPGNNSATDNNTTLTPQADVSVSKSDGVAAAVPGQQVVYTIVAANAGPSNDPSVMVSDAFPAVLTCAWTSAAAGGASGNTNGSGPALGNTLNLPAGSSVTYTVTCDIAPDATGTLINTVTATASVTDPVPGNNSATDSDNLTPQADLEIIKTGDPGTVQAGETLTYTLTVTNLGPSDATGVTITDILPAAVTLVSTTGCTEPVGVPTCTIGNLAVADGPAEVTIEVTVNPAPPASFDNTATVAGNETDPVPGNNSDTATTTTDLVPPTVTHVDSVPDTGDGELAACESSRVAFTQLIVRFSEELQAGGGNPGDADDPASYLLVGTGTDLEFQTVDCTMPIDPADHEIEINAVDYQVDVPADPESTATLSINNGAPLSDGQYRLLACDTLRDLAGNELDGGNTFTRDFRVDAGNLFVNGNFDCVLPPWQESPTASFEWASEDADGSMISGSAELQTTSGTPFELSQCTNVDTVAVPGPYTVGAQVRLVAAPGDLYNLSLTCNYFAAADCAGTPSPSSSGSGVILTSPFGDWVEIESEMLSPPLSTVSLRCRFIFDNPQGTPFSAYLDRLTLRGNGPIFADGFESGDTSAWSLTNN